MLNHTTSYGQLVQLYPLPISYTVKWTPLLNHNFLASSLKVPVWQLCLQSTSKHCGRQKRSDIGGENAAEPGLSIKFKSGRIRKSEVSEMSRAISGSCAWEPKNKGEDVCKIHKTESFIWSSRFCPPMFFSLLMYLTDLKHRSEL